MAAAPRAYISRQCSIRKLHMAKPGVLRMLGVEFKLLSRDELHALMPAAKAATVRHRTARRYGRSSFATRRRRPCDARATTQLRQALYRRYQHLPVHQRVHQLVEATQDGALKSDGFLSVKAMTRTHMVRKAILTRKTFKFRKYHVFEGKQQDFGIPTLVIQPLTLFK